MNHSTRRRLSWVVTVGLLLPVLGGARPTVPAPLSGGPSSGCTTLLSTDTPDLYMQFDAGDAVMLACPPGSRLAIEV